MQRRPEYFAGRRRLFLQIPRVSDGTFDAGIASMDTSKPHPRGRITQNPVTEDEVNRRARELALIAGRKPNHPTLSDFRQARGELLGDDRADAAADDPEITSSGMGAPPTSRGHQMENHLPTDDEDETRTVQEGVDEAEHSRMLEAAKWRTRNG